MPGKFKISPRRVCFWVAFGGTIGVPLIVSGIVVYNRYAGQDLFPAHWHGLLFFLCWPASIVGLIVSTCFSCKEEAGLVKLGQWTLLAAILLLMWGMMTPKM